MRKRFLLLSVVSLLSCINQTPSAGESTDPYIQNLKEQYPEHQTHQTVYPQIDGLYQPNDFVTTENCKGLIVSDYAEKTLFLMNTEGDVIHQTGSEGRGPEEYQSITDLHIGDDGRLYVIDALLFRISMYNIEDDRLEFIESVSYKNPENYFLAAVHVTEYGHFGLFQESPNGFFSPENHYYLYSLNEKFIMKDKLLEIPGHERLKFVTSQMNLYTPYEYSGRTYWVFDHDRFYYITTKNDTIHRYHLENGGSEALSFLDLDERPKSDAFMETVKEHHPNSADEVFLEKLHQIETLPLFSAFHVENQKIFLNVLAAPGQDQVILYIDLVSEDVKYFETPNGFTPQSLCGNQLYGFEFSLESETRLMDIEISFQE